MGEVFKPEDRLRGQKKLIENSVRDLSPGVRETAKRILESWNGMASKKRLIELLGDENTQHILKKMRL